jgi:hypothetical protein
MEKLEIWDPATEWALLASSAATPRAAQRSTVNFQLSTLNRSVGPPDSKSKRPGNTPGPSKRV